MVLNQVQVEVGSAANAGAAIATSISAISAPTAIPNKMRLIETTSLSPQPLLVALSARMTVKTEVSRGGRPPLSYALARSPVSIGTEALGV